METIDERNDDFQEFLEYSDTLKRLKTDSEMTKRQQFTIMAQTLGTDKKIEQLKKAIASVKEETKEADDIEEYLCSVKNLIHQNQD